MSWHFSNKNCLKNISTTCCCWCHTKDAAAEEQANSSSWSNNNKWNAIDNDILTKKQNSLITNDIKEENKKNLRKLQIITHVNGEILKNH